MIKKVRAVIYDIKNKEPYFLVLHRILRWSGWEILKETLENSETLIEALVRGIKEETQLKNFEIIRDLNKTESWQKDGINYEIVATFLVKADMNEAISLKQEIREHDGYDWLDRKSAVEKLTWPETKELIKQVEL